MLALARSALRRLTRVQFFDTDLFLDSGRIFAGAGVDRDQFTFLDEGGDPKDIAGFQGGRLGVTS